MADLMVNGRSFRDLDSYNAAKRDVAFGERMKDRIDMTKLEDVTALRDSIESGKYRFETVIGEDFLDELDEVIRELESQKQIANDKKSNKGRIGKGKKNNKDVSVKNNAPVKTIDDYDEDMRNEIRRQMKKADKRRTFFIIIMSMVALSSIGYLVFYAIEYAHNEAQFEEIATLVNEDAGSSEYSVTLVSEDKSKPPILKKYESVYQKNKKIVGWLSIEGTDIDYPVMQTVNNDYYLDHNFNQEYDKNGSIFLDKDCDPAFPNDNMIIYGHHMKSGRMFGNLNRYSKESYYKEHPIINFDTIYAEGKYRVMYVFRSRIYSEDEIVFKYYKFIDATSEDEFRSNMEEMAKMSLYDTGVTASYGDKLITLSTCDSSENNGRFVVVAKKID